MNVRLNQKVRAMPKNKRSIGHQPTKERFGKIVFVNNNLFVVKFKNYKECFNVADIVNPNRYMLKTWTGKEWAAIN